MALSSLPGDSLQSFTKAQVIELAQEHCDSSFTVPSDPGKFHTAWNSINTLLNKDLVQERGRPLRKYALTEDGWEMARRIKRVENREVLHDDVGNSNTKDIFTQSKEVHKPKKISETSADIVDLEEHWNDLDMISLPPISFDRSKEPVEPPSSGQRLGGEMVDTFGTFSKTHEGSAPKPALQSAAKPDFVEIPSSPEPAKKPRPDTDSKRDTRPLSVISGNRSAPVRGTAPTKPPQKSTSSSSNTPIPAPKPAQTLPTFTPVALPPGSFTIRLVLDSREIRAKEDRNYISSQLSLLGVSPLVRTLPLGDIFWVAQLHDPSLLSHHGEDSTSEIALDWIVERKRLDDLVGSITDGRFSEQKFRLRRSGVRNVIYLIEHISLGSETTNKFGEAMTSAIASTQVVNGYFVKRTKGLDESIRYLARMTALLKSMYEGRPLHVIPTSALSPATHLPLLDHLRTDPAHREKKYNITFPAFASLASKSDTLTLRDVYLKMLMCTRGVSGDKALAIQKVWPTPKAFLEAFEACADDKERDGMVERALGELVGKGKVKGVLGRKVGDVWGKA